MLRAAAVTGLGLALFAGAARSQPAAEPASANRVVFEDAKGEDPGELDIARVVVGSSEDGEIAFRIELPTNPTFTDDMRIRVAIDTNDEKAMARRENEYFFLVDNYGANLYACRNPPMCDVFGPRLWRSFGFSYAAGAATFSTELDDLGGVKRLRLRAIAYDGIAITPGVGYDFTNAHVDFAPEAERWWTYDTRALVAKSFSASPASPRAGRPFSLSLTTVRTDTGAIARGPVSCSFKLAGKTLTARAHGFIGRRARCAFDIPATSRGARFRSSISVAVAGHALTRSISGRIQ
jgi:hypothetical protein